MSAISETSSSEIFDNVFLLETLFSFLPLSAGKKICCVSKKFHEIWIQTRLSPAIDQFSLIVDGDFRFKNHIFFFKMLYLQSSCFESKIKRPTPLFEKTKPAMVIANVIKEALQNLNSSDERFFFLK